MEANKTSGQSGIDTGLIGMTSDIVSAYLANNQIRPDEVSNLINTVHTALHSTVSGGSPQTASMQQNSPHSQNTRHQQNNQQRGEPPVSIKKSMTPDYLISLEDGKQYKSLKRHLTGRGLTPEQYREKWNLPPTYPMVAPNYAQARSDLAKKMGLGQKRTGTSKAKTARGKATGVGTGRGRKKAA